MKKVVVFVDGEPTYFDGEDLQVHNRSVEVDISRTRYAGPELLIVEDEGVSVGVFQKWDYWKKLD